MKRTVMAAASYYKRACYFSPDYEELPGMVQQEVRAAAAVAAEQARGVVTLGFYADGRFFAEASGEDMDSNYDDINARLVVDRFLEERAELISSLTMWYKLYKTPEGRNLLDALPDGADGDD